MPPTPPPAAAMAHTKGPWSRNIKPARKYPVIFSGRNKHVAIVCERGLSDAEIEANCDLIAAAPDLFAALRSLLAEAEMHITPTSAVCVRARAALRVAEGGAG